MQFGLKRLQCTLTRSATQPPPPINLQLGPPSPLERAVGELERRSYKTYLARVKTAQRLRGRDNGWNFAMVALSSGLLLASVGLLVNGNVYGPHSALLITGLSVLALVASLVIANVGYGRRSRDAENNYKRIQALSLEAEQFFLRDSATQQDFLRLQDRYNALLEASENHTAADYHRSRNCGSCAACCRSSSAMTVLPYLCVIVPVCLLIVLIRSFS